MKYSQTFPGHIKPVRPGVYQRLFGSGWGYAKWSGEKWMYASNNAQFASEEKIFSPRQSEHPWRGLAEKHD